MMKLFEEYNNQYYQEISYVDQTTFPFTEKELLILKDLFNNIKYYNKYGFIINDKSNLKSRVFYIVFYSTTIKKLLDEWFILTTPFYFAGKRNGFKNYKCDQMEGLLKCIEDVCDI